MSQDNLAMTPDSLRAYDRWHLIIGLILLLLLVLLPLLFGIGPNSWTSCAAPATPATAAPAPTPAPAPAPTAPAAEAAKPAAATPKAIVYFDSGKSAVGSQGIDDLKALAAAAGPSARLAVSGFHDAKGDPAKNAELAKQRALAVRDALKAAGVAEERIELRKPEATSAAHGLDAEAQARRVEVGVVN